MAVAPAVPAHAVSQPMCGPDLTSVCLTWVFLTSVFLTLMVLVLPGVDTCHSRSRHCEDWHSKAGPAQGRGSVTSSFLDCLFVSLLFTKTPHITARTVESTTLQL